VRKAGDNRFALTRVASTFLCAALCCALEGCGSDESIEHSRSAENPGLAPWTNEDLLDVWGSAPNDVWAVGTNGSALHFDGKAWVSLSSGTTLQLSGVSGSSSSDVWMVGGESIAVHWNGAGFENSLGEPDDELLGVWSGGEGHVFATGISAGIAFLRHFDGQVWAGRALTQAGSLWDVWGNAATDVWAVGTGRNNKGFLLRWDGTAWDFEGYDGAPLRSVWGTGPNDVWTVAYDGPIQHWDGVGWRAFDENFRLFGVWGSGERDVWAIGAEGALVHYDGSTWAVAPSGTTENLWGIWGTAQNDVWIVGGNGTMLHFDGLAWTQSFRSG
jgi:hypothetical protein